MAIPLSAQEEEFQVYGDHPRLFLNARRLRLLRRERDRTSPRWMQFETLVAGKVRMPEPGFAWALYHEISQSETFGRQAIEWSLSPEGKDLRQLALVFDWCQDLLTAQQSTALRAKIRKVLALPPTKKTFPAMRDRVLAAVAIAGGEGDTTRQELQKIVQQWWRKEVAPLLREGRYDYPREDSYALLELMHAVRDAINIDLRDDAPKYFKELPGFQILSYYPAAFPAPENEFRIPFYTGDGDPDLRIAVLSRAADLSLVAYDPNAQETQFVQGWLIHDRFLMRGAFGIPYEFLWANPYQPGLSYYHLPLSMHHAGSGRLALRSSWEDDATWLHYSNGKVQVFQDGRRRDTKIDARTPVDIAGTLVYLGKSGMKFTVEETEELRVFVVGLEPRAKYDVEVDDEELTEYTADGGGILDFTFQKMTGRGVRINRSPARAG